MKTIIAEKSSVAKEIAHIVGAYKREEGYMQGNGYYVTWAFGHLVQPAMPETYGMKGFHAENLPVIPDPFVLVPRQVKTENGYCLIREKVVTFRMVKLNMLLSIFLITK